MARKITRYWLYFSAPDYINELIFNVNMLDELIFNVNMLDEKVFGYKVTTLFILPCG